MTKFVLFDIDGTLIDSGGAGSRALTRAFSEILSIENAFVDIDMAGKTDIEIIKEGLAASGSDSGDELLPSILEGYIHCLKTEVNNNRRHLMPGVLELLDHLKASKGYRLGLLTGNIEQGARIKLGVFDLNAYFPIGAFGSDDEDRNRLLPVAVRKLREMGAGVSYSDCIVIGDTPRDVRCSKPFGATSIAVSTGPYSYGELLMAGADHVLRDLSHATEFVEELKGN